MDPIDSASSGITARLDGRVLQKATLGLFWMLAFAAAARAGGPAVPAEENAGSEPNAPLSAAALNVADQLDLVTTNIFTGGTGVFNDIVNVFITSTVAASKPATATSTKYQDSELLLPQGGVLNIFVSHGSVNLESFKAIQKKFESGDEAKSGVPAGPGRDQIADRLYFDGWDKAISNADKAAAYWINGAGVKLLNRNADTTTTNDISNYGVSGMAYVGVGADGTLSTTMMPAGNFRLEAMIDASWTDSVSMHTMYTTTPDPRNVNYAVVAHVQLAIINKLGINLQAGWPLGGARRYEGKVLLAGITLSR